MKKIILAIMIAATVAFVATDVKAQPFTPTMAADTYGIAQGGGNLLGIDTPKDDNDNPVGKKLDINDAVNLLLGSAFAHNSDVDNLRVTTGDSVWKDLSTTDDDGTYVFLGLTAANANTLRVYDVTAPATKLAVLPTLSGFDFLGNGSLASPFLAGFSPLASGTNFGWNLLSDPAVGANLEWDSNPILNAGGYDHMLTYDLAALAGKTVYIKTACTDINDLSTCTVTPYTFYKPYLIVWEDKPFNAATGLLGDEDFDDTMFLVDRVAPIPEPMSLMLMGSGLAGLASIRRRKV